MSYLLNSDRITDSADISAMEHSRLQFLDKAPLGSVAENSTRIHHPRLVRLKRISVYLSGPHVV